MNDLYVKIKILQSEWELLPREIRSLFEIMVIEPEKEKYPDNEQWNKLNKEYIKSFKQLKELEFKLRNA